MNQRNDARRFAIRLPQNFLNKQVIAATWTTEDGRCCMDYLLYIPIGELPDGGAWVDVVQATNLPNLMSAGTTRPDDPVDAVDLLGYFDQKALFTETCFGWTTESVGDGNYYIVDADVPAGAHEPESVEGIVLRVARSGTRLTHRRGEVELEGEVVDGRYRLAHGHHNGDHPRRWIERDNGVLEHADSGRTYIVEPEEQQMDVYVGTILAKCRAMTRGEYNQLRGWTLPENENPDDTGMLLDIVNGKSSNIEGFDGYVTWLPTAEFEYTYRRAKGLDFGRAKDLLRQGIPMCRAGWNGKGMFVYYVPPGEYPARTGVAKQYYGDKLVPYNEYLAIKNVDGSVSTWVPSINDVFAEDWMTSH